MLGIHPPKGKNQARISNEKERGGLSGGAGRGQRIQTRPFRRNGKSICCAFYKTFWSRNRGVFLPFLLCLYIVLRSCCMRRKGEERRKGCMIVIPVRVRSFFYLFKFLGGISIPEFLEF